MKWVVLALMILSVPLMWAWLRSNPKQAPVLWAMLTFMPFVLEPWHLAIAPYATPLWLGYVKGWQVSFLDSIALAVIFSTRARWPRLPLMVPFLLYFFVVVLSVFQARFGNYAWAYVIQLMRVALVMVAVARVCVLERGEKAILTGMILGLSVQAIYALIDRAGGAIQTGGSMGHQNLLGFVAHMVVMTSFAMLLARRWPGLALVGLLAGAVAVVLTASRAAIALSGAGLAITLFLSFAIRMSGRKAAVGFAGVVMLLAVVPFANASLDRRFSTYQASFFQEDQERLAFKRAAWMMMDEKPFGVGPNHYVFISNTEGYGARAGVNWSTANRSAHVHNSYLLVGAESGYLGMITFILLLGSSIALGLATAIRFRRQPCSEVVLGVTAAIIAMCIHAFVEWMFLVQPTQYLLGAGLGVICGIRSRCLAQERAAKTGARPSRPIRQMGFGGDPAFG